MNFEEKDDSLEAARSFDFKDKLKDFRNEFTFPKDNEGNDCLYFAGHSLGLRPKKAVDYITEELEDWGIYGVEGHFEARHPWMPYHEFLTDGLSRLVGAKPTEVVAMNTLTTNLHLMMVSFYRPTKDRYKILIENNTFPSDKYAVDSQARFHGYDSREAILELEPDQKGMVVSQEKLIKTIEENADSLALIMLGNCNYLSGQCFDFKSITDLAHSKGIMVGFNLAHGAGNLELDLHDWGVDFAVWCSYKYLNSGPGGLAGAFVHERHHKDKNIPRFEGWWGHDKETRFKMGPNFEPIESVEAWQLSNPPIFQLASMRASLELFDKATMKNLREKGNHLTSYMQFLFEKKCKDFVEVITPDFNEEKQTRGSMLCLRFKKDPKKLVNEFKNKGVICDFREPDILRMTPIPLYNSYEDVYKLVSIIKDS